MKIFVAGHKGLVGSAVTRKIEGSSQDTWIGAPRTALDLRKPKETLDFIAENRPDAIILAAAKVGGIEANRRDPYSFLTENMRIQRSVIDAAIKLRIPNLIFLGSSCIYPKFAHQPISENALLSGPLEPTNEAYAIAKISGLREISYAADRFELNWGSAMPTNLYGLNDNFNPETSHVLPALIRKFWDARQRGRATVTLWGDGSPLREFLYADDLANALLKMLRSPMAGETFNVGSGQEISIKDLALKISNHIGFQGEILWDKSKPNGTPRKLLNSEKLSGLVDWQPQTSLDEGIKQTLEWYTQDIASAALG